MADAVFELPAVTAYQASAIFGESRSAVVEATTKAGKTYGCILWLLHQALNGSPGHEFWWVAPIYEQTKIAFRRFKALLRDTDPSGSLWKANDTDPSITLGNGSVLRFKTAEKPDGLYGEDVYAAVVDEASRCKEEAWHAVRSTLTATQGRVRIIGNVKGRKNWAYALARRVEAGGLPGWGYAKITAHDAVRAGIISADEVASAKRELPEHVFKELYLAEPSEDGANPFGLQHIAACVHDDCVVALGLANERARRYTGFGAAWVPRGPEPKEPVEDVLGWFRKMREDPDWGFDEPAGRARWN